jgi:hypothetical protein
VIANSEDATSHVAPATQHTDDSIRPAPLSERMTPDAKTRTPEPVDSELLQEVAAGPEASVARLFPPPAPLLEDVEAIGGLGQTARSSSNVDVLKVCWLKRVIRGPDPLREKLTPF